MINILEFNPGWKRNIAVCFVDNTRQYRPEIRELIKNQADGVLANLYKKGYTVFQWVDEDALINHVSTLGYDFALVVSTGTEFINMNQMNKSLKKVDQISQSLTLESKSKVSVKHILDGTREC